MSYLARKVNTKAIVMIDQISPLSLRLVKLLIHVTIVQNGGIALFSVLLKLFNNLHAWLIKFSLEIFVAAMRHREDRQRQSTEMSRTVRIGIIITVIVKRCQDTRHQQPWHEMWYLDLNNLLGVCRIVKVTTALYWRRIVKPCRQTLSPY